jgi:hypothetical protein
MFIRSCIIIFSMLVGAYMMKIYNDIQLLDCHDFTTKHSVWKGFMAKDLQGDVRCFWLEQEHPNRVRQGVPL